MHVNTYYYLRKCEYLISSDHLRVKAASRSANAARSSPQPMHFNLQDCVICFALLIYSFLVLFYILINCFFFTHVNCYHHPQKYCSLLLIYYSFTTTPTLHNAKNIYIIKQQSFKTHRLFAFAFTSKHPTHTP